MVRKKVLFILQRGPQGGCRARETLDLLLTTAAFEQAVSVLLLDDGVFQVKRGQQPDRIGGIDVAPLFQSLDLYDVPPPFVERESLEARGIGPEQLSVPVTLVARSAIAALIAGHDCVIGG